MIKIMKKYLPIKIIKKRDHDKALNNLAIVDTEKSGKRFKLEGEELNKRVEIIDKYLGELSNKIINKTESNNYLPTLVKLRINQYALAKTYRGAIGNIFNQKRKKINIIGLIGEDELLVKIDKIKDLNEISQKIKDTERNVLGISAIEQAEDFLPIVEIDRTVEADLKIKLVNYGDYNLNEIAQINFEKYCKDSSINFKKLNYAKDLLVYRVTGITPQELINSNTSDSIFSISLIPIIKLSKNQVEDGSTISIKIPEEGIDYFRVGVFDDGINDIEHLKAWKGGSYVAFNTDEYDASHGTFVAGIINYGDQLEGKDWTGTKPFKITEAVIFPNNRYGYIDEPMIVDFMRSAVKKHPEIKVWNFSIGNETEISDVQYSDFAKYLDDLQDEYNILIIKAAGNCDNFIYGKPRGRITEGSESIRSLVVGSLAHDKRDQDISAYNHPSPFTMIGPGCSDVIKPDLVHYGGNVGLSNGKIDINGVKSFSKDGLISCAAGTSYSAPRITAIAGELSGSLKEEFNSDLIKALIIHSAKHPEEFDSPFNTRLQHIGFGLPNRVTNILYNDQDEVTLILMDAVDKGTNIKIMDFPFPKCLIDNNYYYGEVTITLVTSPEINTYQGAEYIQSNVDISFGTYDKKIEINESDKIKRNPIDIDDAQNLLLESRYSIRAKKNATPAFKAERFLTPYNIGHRELFVPIKKWCIDLEELTSSHITNFLHKDRLWYLQIKASYRENYESRIIDNKNVSQEFVLIITLKDKKKKNMLYNDVSTLLSRYNFIHENININENIKIR